MYCIEIEVAYDLRTKDTSWELVQVSNDGGSGNELIKSQAGGRWDDTLHSKSCLPLGEYVFVISDPDGISPPGYYNVTTTSSVGEEVIVQGGEFDISESTFFSIPYVPAS